MAPPTPLHEPLAIALRFHYLPLSVMLMAQLAIEVFPIPIATLTKRPLPDLFLLANTIGTILAILCGAMIVARALAIFLRVAVFRFTPGAPGTPAPFAASAAAAPAPYPVMMILRYHWVIIAALLGARWAFLSYPHTFAPLLGSSAAGLRGYRRAMGLAALGLSIVLTTFKRFEDTVDAKKREAAAEDAAAAAAAAAAAGAADASAVTPAAPAAGAAAAAAAGPKAD